MVNMKRRNKRPMLFLKNVIYAKDTALNRKLPETDL